MPIWNQLGMQAAGNAMSGAMGLILGNINDRRQLRQQQKLQDQQIRGSKELTDYNYLKQMQMWNETNYPAQMAMLKKAGLNPALIYDNGGMQAETTISPGDVQGGEAPKGGGEAMALMQNQNLALITAQIENIKAQTEKTKAETGAVAPGIDKTLQETKNLKTQNALQEIQKAFEEETFKNKASIINIGLSKLIEEARILENDREISDQTKQTKINQLATDLQNSILQGLNLQKQNAKTDKEIQHIDKQIQHIQQELDINKIEEEMAKDGWNPKAGGVMRIFYNIIKRVFNFIYE